MQEQMPGKPADPESVEATPEEQVDSVKVREFLAKLKREQSLPGAILGGALAAAFSAVAWAVVTVVTGYQFGWMAIGIGFVVGAAVRNFGSGVSPLFAVIGCCWALLGCLVGNLLSACGLVAAQESIPLSYILSNLNVELAMALLSATYSPLDALFYGIAAYGAYQYSIRRLTEGEILSLVKTQS